MGVEVVTEQRDGGLMVALSGDLDVASAPSVEERLGELELPESPAVLVLDLRGLSFIDSTGLSLLINTDSRARKAGRHVTIVSGRGAPRRLLETTGLNRRLDVVEEWERGCVQPT
ncbi:MAG TPA: STAS domain-containing protein [Thermoleophilaceae bacterium]|nr:STAS domain-containing protein [Thermoleophilaceae bacterium]